MSQRMYERLENVSFFIIIGLVLGLCYLIKGVADGDLAHLIAGFGVFIAMIGRRWMAVKLYDFLAKP